MIYINYLLIRRFFFIWIGITLLNKKENFLEEAADCLWISVAKHLDVSSDKIFLRRLQIYCYVN